MSKRYDVIIAGGGPAGGTAAFYLGQAGQKVLVLEKEHLPRYKTCGGAVSIHVLEQFPFSFEPIIRSRVNKVSYALGDRAVSIRVNDPSLCMFMRSELDAFILEHAQAEIRDGQAVRSVEETSNGVIVETSTGERLETDFVVGADGATSAVARSIGLRREKVLAGAIELEVPVPDPTLERYRDHLVLIFGDIPVGYSWIFPKGDHLSIGIGSFKPGHGELQAALLRCMERFGIPIDIQTRHGHPLPVYTHAENLATSRGLLAGDAAGLVDAFTGEGIRFAIKSGRLAAEAILSGALDGYTSEVDRLIGRNHRLGYGMNRIFYRVIHSAFKLGMCDPVVTQGFMRFFADRVGYRTLLLTLAGTFPLALIKRKLPLKEFVAL